MPGPLKAGLEALSGMDLSGIRVHRNSSKPAELDAFAYTRGQEIHVAPGQEAHLPHEAWHAVQQMQGRVTPTLHAGGESINADPRLEQEADAMGAKASQMADHARARPGQLSAPAARGQRPTIQRAMKFEFQTGNYVWKVGKAGTDPEPLPRKYGATEDPEGGEGAFLATGLQGDPAVEVGDLVKAKGIDKTKAAQYIQTYRVIDREQGTVKWVGQEKRKAKDEFNPGTYEIRYIDADGKPLDLHRDRRGNFHEGPGELLQKATQAKEGTAIELQSENEGFVEFETPKWFRRWSDLELRIQEAVDMTAAMSAAPLVTDQALKDAVKSKVESLKADNRSTRKKDMGALHEWPESLKIDQLPISKAGGKLLVEIVDPSWYAAIQSSESIALTQFESLLNEHDPSRAGHAVSHADALVTEAAESAEKPPAELANLRSFLQLIFYYIESGRRMDLREKRKDESVGPPGPSKYAFLVMSRTSFSSIYRSLLNDDEKEIFAQIVRDKLIVRELMKNEEERMQLGGLEENSKFFRWGHGGSASYGPTIDKWLKSIVSPGSEGRKIKNKEKKWLDRDLLSHPERGSAAMGAFDVETAKGEDDTDLVRFEIRYSKAHIGGRNQPASNWVKYADEVFKHAAEKRKRPKTKDDPATLEDETEKTSLIYDPEPAPPPKFELDLRLDHDPATEEEGFELEFRTFLPTLLDGRLQPFVYTGIGTRGLSAGAGISADPFADMALFLTGKGGIRTDWFKSIEYGGGLEAGWAFGEDRSIRLGIGWETWQRLDEDQQRSHLFGVFFGKRF